MSNIIKVNDMDLVIKEYQNKRVITLKEMDELHARKEGTAKRNFNNHMNKFVESEDYFRIPVHEYRGLFSPNEDAKRGNPNFNVILLTEMGYLLLVKTFHDDIAWQVQKSLVHNYFRFQALTKAEPPTMNEFDFMRNLVDKFEQSRKTEGQLIQVLQMMQERMDRLEIRLDDNVYPIETTGLIEQRLLKASDVAHQLKLFSLNGLPHSRIIASIARKLGFKINVKTYYEDDYIAIMQEGDEETALTWQIYYKPAGVDRIIDWFNKNRDEVYYEHYYKKNSKHGNAGELREAGYRIRGVNFAIAVN